MLIHPTHYCALRGVVPQNVTQNEIRSCVASGENLTESLRSIASPQSILQRQKLCEPQLPYWFQASRSVTKPAVMKQ
jgi:hypothetical protein